MRGSTIRTCGPVIGAWRRRRYLSGLGHAAHILTIPWPRRPVKACPAWYNGRRKRGERYGEQKVGAQGAGLHRGHGDGRQAGPWRKDHRPERGRGLHRDGRGVPGGDDAADVHRPCGARPAESAVPARDGDVVEA